MLLTEHKPTLSRQVSHSSCDYGPHNNPKILQSTHRQTGVQVHNSTQAQAAQSNASNNVCPHTGSSLHNNISGHNFKLFPPSPVSNSSTGGLQAEVRRILAGLLNNSMLSVIPTVSGLDTFAPL
jgi:hypothetical protein